MTATLERRLEAAWEPPRSLYSRLASVDHKVVGARYLVTGFVFLVLGGVEALMLRLQLARAGAHLLTPEQYDQLFTMHGITMIFWYAAPVLSGFSNYLIPLMIGTRDMAFPRLNAFSYWSFLLSGVVLYTSLLLGLAPHGGWFAYPPLTDAAFSPGLNLDFYAIALLFLTISTTVGAINFIVTIFLLRCPGMSLARMPLFGWSTLTSSFAVVFSLPALTVALVFLELQRRYGFHFFDAGYGHPLLWQHLFWVFGHPWVYIVILPATGMVSMMLPTFCRRPIVGHTFIAAATVATGVAGFGVWAHHMFATGMPQMSSSFFSAASMTVSIPSGMQIFAWIATLWGSRRFAWRTPFLFIVGFIVLFCLGGFSGVMTAVIPSDWQTHDTYFVVAHLHYVLVGINLFPVVAGFHYWSPKFTGRMMSERLGRLTFWLMFIGMNLTFFPMHILGLLGMPRRVYTYPAGRGWDAWNMVETVGSWLFALGVLVFLFNAWRSRRRGAPSGDNPWNASSLEWATSSPPPAFNFARVPVVRGREPLWEGEPRGDAPVPPDRELADGKEIYATTILDGTPRLVLRMPHDSLAPLLLACSLMVLAYGLVFRVAPLSAAGAALTAACVIGWLRRAGGAFAP